MIRLTRKQSREVDRIAIEEYGIPSIVLMENAARSAVDAMADLLPKRMNVLLLCGPGNNGGDGLAVARHLTIRGHDVGVCLTAPPEDFKGDAAINLRTAQKMVRMVKFLPNLDEWDGFGFSEMGLVIDAIFGTGLNRPPSGGTVAMINGCNRRGLPFKFPLVSLDVPSGLDCDTGQPLGTCIRATRTITFAAEKTGFAVPSVLNYTGDIVVADIGVPHAIITKPAAFHD